MSHELLETWTADVCYLVHYIHQIKTILLHMTSMLTLKYIACEASCVPRRHVGADKNTTTLC